MSYKDTWTLRNSLLHQTNNIHRRLMFAALAVWEISSNPYDLQTPLERGWVPKPIQDIDRFKVAGRCFSWWSIHVSNKLKYCLGYTYRHIYILLHLFFFCALFAWRGPLRASWSNNSIYPLPAADFCKCLQKPFMRSKPFDQSSAGINGKDSKAMVAPIMVPRLAIFIKSKPLSPTSLSILPIAIDMHAAGWIANVEATKKYWKGIPIMAVA